MKGKKRSSLLGVCLFLAYSTLFSYISILKHYSFQSTAWDLGIFSRALINSMRGRFLYVEFLPYHNPLAFHTQFTLLAFFPLFLLYPRPETLLVSQSFLIGLSGLILFRFVRETTDNVTIALIFQLSFYLNPALHGVNLFDFHPEVFALPFIFLLLREYSKKNYFKGLIFATIILLSKEDFSLVLIALGLVNILELLFKISHLKLREVLIREKVEFKGDKKIFFANSEFLFGICYIFVGLFYLFLAFNYIFPFFGVKSFLFRYRYGGFELNRLLVNLFYDFNRKMLYLFVLLLPVAFLIFFSPRYIFVLFIVSSEFLLSVYSPMYTIGYQYPIPMLPIIYFGSSKGLEKVVSYDFSSISFPKKFFFFDRLKGAKVFCLMLLILSTSLFSTFNYSPVRNVELPDYHDEILKKVLALIPENSSVATSNQILPHLINIRDVHIKFIGYEDYILVDLTGPYLYGDLYSPFNSLNDLSVALSDYKVLVLIDGVLVLRKGRTVTSISAEDIGIEHTLKCEYYIDTVEGEKLVLIEDISTLNRDFATIYPLIPNGTNKTLKLVLKGYLYFPTNGEYSFQIISAGNTEILIDENKLQNSRDGLFKILIKKGLHRIQIEIEIEYSNPIFKLMWKLPNSDKFELITPKFIFNSEK